LYAPAKPPLLIAEAANPEWSSVPLVGWSHSRAIQRATGAHIVTQVRNRDAFERAGMSTDQYTAIDSEKVARLFSQAAHILRGGSGKGWTTAMALSAPRYYYFEHLFWQQFGPRIEAGEFSLVHRLTPLSPTTPSIIAPRCRRAGVPFLLGPLNGGVPWPRAFDKERREEKEWLSYVRGAYRLLPGYRSTRADAAAIICGSRHTESEVPAKYREKVVYIPENAIEPERFQARRTRDATVPIRCIYLGRLVPYKGADIALQAAVPMLREGLLTFTFVGDGPLRPKLTGGAGFLGSHLCDRCSPGGTTSSASTTSSPAPRQHRASARHPHFEF
jgi:glycosyltransferase involved in cell wall biosynthesis